MSKVKGIILAGGSGSRLKPLTNFMCKQLLPVYDKPLLYYPLTTLILAGIKDILIISTPQDTPIISKNIGDGSNLGINIEYQIQSKPSGLADAFIIGEEFIGSSPVCMILGDNILNISNFSEKSQKWLTNIEGAQVFGLPVSDPERFGVIEVAPSTQKILSLEEKPQKPKSNLATIGFLHL